MVAVLVTLLVLATTTSPLAAQTDFYNLDKDRPLRVEDAYATKRWAFELQVSPFTLSQDRSDLLRFAPSIELKHGILPGVEVSVGSHFEWDRLAGETSTGLGSVEISTLANLWVESGTLPAVGVRATGHLPTDSDDSSWAEVRLLATRGLAGRVRAHVNGAWLGGDGRTDDWWAGLALDYVLPFHHTLLLGETWIAEPRSVGGAAAGRALHSRLGLRHQLSPTLALDGGVGRGWSGETRQDWFVTVGIAHEFAVRGLMPPRRR